MAVTENQLIDRSGLEARSGGPVAASTTLYEGTLAFVNATGYLDDDTATGANSFAGVVVEEADNSGGADGDISAEYHTEGVYTLTGSGFTQADVGSLAYASDNYTVTTTATSNTKIGVIREVISATQVRVALHKET